MIKNFGRSFCFFTSSHVRGIKSTWNQERATAIFWYIMSRVVLSADYATSGVMRFFATRATARVAKQKRNNATSGHNAQNHEWHSCIFATSVIMECLFKILVASKISDIFYVLNLLRPFKILLSSPKTCIFIEMTRISSKDTRIHIASSWFAIYKK